MVNDKTRLLNRLTSSLKAYFPQVLAWFQPLDTYLVYAFLQRWPTLEAVQAVDERTLWQFFHHHHSKRRALNERRITEIRQAIPATTDEAVLTAFVMVVQWIRIIFHCWQTHTLYNKRTYLSALQKRGSSLMKLLAEAPA